MSGEIPSQASEQAHEHLTIEQRLSAIEKLVSGLHEKLDALLQKKKRIDETPSGKLKNDESVPTVTPDFLRELRKKLDLTQAKAAEYIGVATRTWISWENEQGRPSKAARVLILQLAEGNTMPSYKMIREKLGLTQKEISEKLGVALSTWQNWEYCLRTPNKAAVKLIQSLEEQKL